MTTPRIPTVAGNFVVPLTFQYPSYRLNDCRSQITLCDCHLLYWQHGNLVPVCDPGMGDGSFGGYVCPMSDEWWEIINDDEFHGSA